MSLDIVIITLGNFLKDFRKEDMAYAIKRDISLRKLIDQLQPQIIIGMLKFVKITGYFNKEIQEGFNYENVMEWMKDTRPELYDEIKSTKIGIMWFRKNIEDIKKMLLNDD